MKVVFEKETYRLLGAQIVGYEGVDKRIDVLATAIRAKMTEMCIRDSFTPTITTLIMAIYEYQFFISLQEKSTSTMHSAS